MYLVLNTLPPPPDGFWRGFGGYMLWSETDLLSRLHSAGDPVVVLSYITSMVISHEVEIKRDYFIDTKE